MPHLVVRQPGQVPFAIPLADGMIIGRDARCSLPLTDTKVSRRHAVLSRGPGGWTIVDQGSTHGTFVNDERITSHAIRDGDRLRVGETRLSLAEAETASEVLLTQLTGPASGALAGDAAARLRVFYDVAAVIGALDDADALLARMLDAILAVLGCERGLVGLCEPGGLRRVARTRSGAAASEMVVSRAILDAILVHKQSLVVREPSAHGTLLREHVLSAMGVPLLAAGRTFGLLYVDDRGTQDRFSEADLGFLGALGHLTAAAIDGAERIRRAEVGEPAGADAALGAIVGESEPAVRLRKEIRKFAEAGAHVLIHGESGSGKELVARALHALSARADKPFVTLNCAAIPEAMLESELFGHEKGAFTGAQKDRRGKFTLAHRGTLFLDEIGDLAAAAQAKLLRAIQEGEVQPLGAEKPTHVDVRVVAASHKDLAEEVRAGRFREDLFYRLAVVELRVPPLRERGEDIGLLATTFLAATARRLGKSVVGFSAEALAALAAYRWPGNVRELQNEVERAAIVAEGAYVERAELSARVRGGGPAEAVSARKSAAASVSVSVSAAGGSMAERFAALEPSERALVVEALGAAKGNITEAARLLGITRIMMRRRVERFGLAAGED
jgi:Nif-specific regulatory protein